MIAEGIETTASAMKIFDLPGWAAISAGNLRHVELPEVVREVIIAADNDPPGLRAAIAAAQRFRREGRYVRVVKPANCKDFNNLLNARTTCLKISKASKM
jgi:putative DNA primase/helicase